ncbi:MAG TPA: HAMP domain-containing sensor histidine kinase, partial [Candidatus Paceibacterota bacterium]|nr:HAMP domain-containing sensor histidine kinase [Candidatus Paceibacterota bacterium]
DEMERFGKTFDGMRAKVSVFVATLEDAVRTRTAELEEARAELAASISSLPLGFGLFGLDGKLLQSNENLGRLLEAPIVTHVRDIAGRFGEHFSLEDYLCACQEGCEGAEMKEILLDGKFLRCFVIPVTKLSDPRAVLGVAILIEDITESKLLERAKDEFFAVASHELRTPLTAIRGNAGLLRGMKAADRAGDEAVAMLSDIEAASERLIKIVNDFLDVARIEQGGVTFKQDAFDLVPVLRASMTELAPLAKDKALALEDDGVWPETLMVLADPDRTKQVAINLIGNALKFTRKGSVRIEVGWAEDSAVVRVKDTGPGIAPKERSLLFRKFQQAQKDMLARDVSQSTGLGLYIAKLSVERMGGTIELEKSEVGKGSTFRFTIPLVK